jgi:hypothetical protein
MKSSQIASKLVRGAFAVVFAVMSLMHVPITLFAKSDNTSTSDHVSAAAHVVHHQHHQQPAPRIPDNPATSDSSAFCFGLGCFQSATLAQNDIPLFNALLLEQLLPAVPRSLIPVLPDVIDPPPRLQA